MPDVVEYIGEWWLPEKPENKIHGILSYDPRKRTILSLDGAFSERPDKEVLHKIVLGDSYGKKITLETCVQSDLQISPHEEKVYIKSEYLVSVFYVGCHFTKGEDIKFTHLSVSYSQLEEWLGGSLFDYEESRNEEGLTEHILKFTMPDVKQIVLDKFKVIIGYGFSFGVDAWRKPRFETNAGVSVELSDEMRIEEFFSIVYHIRNFLSLATGNRVSILALSGKRKNADQHETIQICRCVSEESPEERLFSPPFFPFQYESISDRPDLYLQNWFDIIEKFEPTYSLYFGTMYNLYLYPTHTFLSLAQALESYLSRIFVNDIMPKELFKELLPRMLKTINEIPEKEYRQQLEPKATHEMNRKSFRTKLKELFEEHGSLFEYLIDDENEFIGKVVDTRNYYTHYSPELEERAVKLLDLPFLSQDLRYVLIAILLREIGFEANLIKRILKKYMRFRIRQVF